MRRVMFCPANWRQRADELAFVIDDLEPVIVVAQRAEVGDAIVAAPPVQLFFGPALEAFLLFLVHDQLLDC